MPTSFIVHIIQSLSADRNHHKTVFFVSSSASFKFPNFCFGLCDDYHLNRHFRRDEGFYLRHLSSKVAVIQDNLSVRVLRNKATTGPNEHNSRDSEQSILSIRSFSFQSSSQDSSLSHSNWTSSSSSLSREHASDSESSSRQEKIGKQLHICIYLYFMPEIFPKGLGLH